MTLNEARNIYSQCWINTCLACPFYGYFTLKNRFIYQCYFIGLSLTVKEFSCLNSESFQTLLSYDPFIILMLAGIKAWGTLPINFLERHKACALLTLKTTGKGLLSVADWKGVSTAHSIIPPCLPAPLSMSVVPRRAPGLLQTSMTHALIF